MSENSMDEVVQKVNQLTSGLAVEMHLRTDPDFVNRYGNSLRRIPNASYSHCRGDRSRRFVRVPVLAATIPMIAQIIVDFGPSRSTTVIFRGPFLPSHAEWVMKVPGGKEADTVETWLTDKVLELRLAMLKGSLRPRVDDLIRTDKDAQQLVLERPYREAIAGLRMTEQALRGNPGFGSVWATVAEQLLTVEAAFRDRFQKDI